MEGVRGSSGLLRAGGRYFFLLRLGVESMRWGCAESREHPREARRQVLGVGLHSAAIRRNRVLFIRAVFWLWLLAFFFFFSAVRSNRVTHTPIAPPGAARVRS